VLVIGLDAAVVCVVSLNLAKKSDPVKWSVLMQSLRTDRRAVNYMAIAIGILGMVLAVYVAAATLPDSIATFTNSSKWENAPEAVKSLVPVAGLIIFFVFLVMLFKFIGNKGGD
jgi:Mn2+/Fe2+ NRAMP family transporter